MPEQLTTADLQLHAALGIDDALSKAAGLYRVDDVDARALLSVNGRSGLFAGVVYPYLDPQTGRVVTHRLRLDVVDADGTKYRAPYGDNRHVYFPPNCSQWLVDPSVPVVIVEAEKSSLAITAAANRANRRLLAIALGGCWNFRGRIGKTVNANGARVDEKGPLSDFQLITWTGRDAIILFDARPNDSVRAARRALARVVRPWGATVKHAHLPDDDGRINGPDDLIRYQGDAALWAVLDRVLAEDFVRNSVGGILSAVLENVRIGLSKLGRSCTYNLFTETVLVNGVPLDDVVLDDLWVAFDDTFHFRPSKPLIATMLGTEARARAFHPVRQYLDALAWDGKARLDTWLCTYGAAPDTPFVRAVGALVLVAAVRRIRVPGVKFDELLVLESLQGLLKSTALRALCPHPDWFSEDLPLGVSSKETIERTRGKSIIEASEIRGLREREAEQLKHFLSRQVDGPVRLAYARLPTEVPRQFVLIGTTNTLSGYLKNHTGGRRFWPVPTGCFDVDAIRRDRDQLWAEAAARERKGASIRLDPTHWEAAGVEQEGRRIEDPWEAILEPLFEAPDQWVSPTKVTLRYVRSSKIWEALGVTADMRNNHHASRVAAIAQRFGFAKKDPIIAGERVRGWAPDPRVDVPDNASGT